jgi:hypothetical protein
MDETTGEGPMTTTIFVRHTVKDYGVWRKGYDAFDSVRKPMGVTNDAVYRAVDNPNDVTVTHDFPTFQAAQAFASSPELKKTMEGAGVMGPPTIWFANKA